MSVEITFVRHGETVGNAEERWQGHTDSDLSGRGREQARRLSARLASIDYDLVVSSDLKRAAATAAALGRPVAVDQRWREPYVGEWENLTTPEIQQRWPTDLAAIMAGRDVAIGGGETFSELLERERAALHDLVARVGSGRALVVGHGLGLLTLLSDLLGTTRPSPLQLMANTGVATVICDDGRFCMPRYNDATHLNNGTGHHRWGHNTGDTQVVLIRHGRTSANDEGRWQGHSDGKLNAVGRRQAAALAGVLPTIDVLYTSPLSRAADTAAAIAAPHQLVVQRDPELIEIGFGEWEGLTRDEIVADHPVDSAGLLAGEDAPRGGSGETFAGVRRRMTRAVESIVARHRGRSIGIVSHGGATRAYVTGILGLEFSERDRLPILGNTAFARLAFMSSIPAGDDPGRPDGAGLVRPRVRGPLVVSWNLAPHLES